MNALESNIDALVYEYYNYSLNIVGDMSIVCFAIVFIFDFMLSV